MQPKDEANEADSAQPNFSENFRECSHGFTSVAIEGSRCRRALYSVVQPIAGFTGLGSIDSFLDKACNFTS